MTTDRPPRRRRLAARRHQALDRDGLDRRRRGRVGAHRRRACAASSSRAGTAGLTTRRHHRQARAARVAAVRAAPSTACVVGEDARLPDADGLRAPFTCLTDARYGIVVGRLRRGARLLRGRARARRPARAVRPPDRRLPARAGRASPRWRSRSARPSCWRCALGRAKDAGRCAPEHISAAKLDNVRAAAPSPATPARLLGGDGITDAYPAMRHMANLEAVMTYEGTPEVHTLILGRALTGVSALCLTRSRPTR